MPIITIDGNIGCGKTSLLNYLHRYHKMVIDLEPVDNWMPYLTKMYNENKDVFQFQIRVWLDRCWVQEKSDVVVLMERSPFLIRNAFLKTVFDNGLICDNENAILQELHDKTVFLWNDIHYIYLRSSPEKCLQRIKKRNRFSEQSISEDYLYQIHNHHEECCKTLVSVNKCTIIDIENKTICEIAKEVIECISKIT
jgi:deoxyadenosine/deoxycytidine kinase